MIKKVSPVAGAGDLIAYLREDRPYKLPMMLAACLPPALIMYMFNADYMEKSKPPPPEVIYFESWPADRSIEETMKAIAERQALKDALLEEKREQYKTAGRVFGMDVDKIEREAKESQAAEKKAKEAAEKEKATAAGEPQ